MEFARAIDRSSDHTYQGVTTEHNEEAHVQNSGQRVTYSELVEAQERSFQNGQQVSLRHLAPILHESENHLSNNLAASLGSGGYGAFCLSSEIQTNKSAHPRLDPTAAPFIPQQRSEVKQFQQMNNVPHVGPYHPINSVQPMNHVQQMESVQPIDTAQEIMYFQPMAAFQQANPFQQIDFLQPLHYFGLPAIQQPQPFHAGPMRFNETPQRHHEETIIESGASCCQIDCLVKKMRGST